MSDTESVNTDDTYSLSEDDIEDLEDEIDEFLTFSDDDEPFVGNCDMCFSEQEDVIWAIRDFTIFEKFPMCRGKKYIKSMLKHLGCRALNAPFLTHQICNKYPALTMEECALKVAEIYQLDSENVINETKSE
jgi:hypothetical protein